MSYRELVKKISTSLCEVLSDRFMDVLLEAKDGGNIPSSLTKAILYHSMRGQLASEAGLVDLLGALAVADPQRAATMLEEFGLGEVAQAMRPAE